MLPFKQQGWTKDTFRPYLQDLENDAAVAALRRIDDSAFRYGQLFSAPKNQVLGTLLDAGIPKTEAAAWSKKFYGLNKNKIQPQSSNEADEATYIPQNVLELLQSKTAYSPVEMALVRAGVSPQERAGWSDKIGTALKASHDLEQTVSPEIYQQLLKNGYNFRVKTMARAVARKLQGIVNVLQKEKATSQLGSGEDNEKQFDAGNNQRLVGGDISTKEKRKFKGGEVTEPPLMYNVHRAAKPYTGPPL